jgi:hypothetical protein
MPTLNIPKLTAYIAGIFDSLIAKAESAKARAEAALPGSGKYFDAEIADFIAAKAAADPAAAAALFVGDLKGWLDGTTPIVHKGSDISR